MGSQYVELHCPYCGKRAGIAGPHSVQCESCSATGPIGHDQSHGEELWKGRAQVKKFEFGIRKTRKGAVAWMLPPTGKLREKRFRNGYASAMISAQRQIDEWISVIREHSAENESQFEIIETHKNKGLVPRTMPDWLVRLTEDVRQASKAFKKESEVNMNTSEAFDTLKSAIQADNDYAWTWHCNVAMPFADEGGSHEQANRAAARFMQTCFDVDVTTFDQWKSFDWAKEVSA